MYITWFFIICLGVIGAASFFIPQGWVSFSLFVMLCLAWAFDAWRTLKQPSPTVVRSYSNPTYQNQSATVELLVTNHLSRSLSILIKDEPPFAVTAEGNSDWLKLSSQTSQSFLYTIHPKQRGTFNFGDINLRYHGAWGLFCHQLKCPLEQGLMVYPNLEKIFAQNRSNRANSQGEGAHYQKIRSVSGELSQLREYTAGDDYRMINWKVSARQSRPILNEFEPEKDQNVFLIFDTGRILYNQASASQSLLDQVVDSAILLAYHVLERGDLLGALSFNCKIGQFLPTGKGLRQLHLFISKFFSLEAEMVESDYRQAFSFWRNKIKKRSLLFIYTELLDLESSKELIKHLQLLAQNHLVVCVLAREQGYQKILEAPLNDEKNAYLKGVTLELLAERRLMKQELLNVGIKILEIESSDLRQSVTQYYQYLKKNGLF